MQPPTASWDVLPAETILYILAIIDDSQSLAALLCACPRAFRLFSVDGGQLLDDLADRTHSAQVAQLIRSTALLRSCPGAFFRSDEAVSVDETLLLHIGQMPYEEHCPPAMASLSQSCCGRPEMVFSLVTTMHRLGLVAVAAVKWFEKNIIEAKPEHLADPEKSYYRENLAPWDIDFEGKPYKAPGIAVVQWIEVERLLRCLWRLQLLDEIKVAAKSLLYNGAETSLMHIDLGTIIHTPAVQMDELLATVSFLDHGQEPPVQRPLQLPLTPCNVSQLPRMSRFDIPSLWREWLPQNPERTIISFPMLKTSYGYVIFNRQTRRIRSPIRDVPRHLYYCFGVPFWEKVTLQKLELLESPQWEGSVCDSIFTWHSLLSQAQIQYVEDMLKEASRQRILIA
ncbi:hypothetical protein VHEMI07608 [[Torrubiella] hemipterigena]|uniref:F-box domain-containing protein n=1 Tax=[Torrubiella] hemipterigena TaxID=1531966 RepID=A0A0A1TLM3_9HYPO|nr:hypothetical protein VHEMI07608 [[Torrubiella] hemipterigena]